MMGKAMDSGMQGRLAAIVNATVGAAMLLAAIRLVQGGGRLRRR